MAIYSVERLTLPVESRVFHLPIGKKFEGTKTLDDCSADLTGWLFSFQGEAESVGPWLLFDPHPAYASHFSHMVVHKDQFIYL